ncbi:MAG TPA: hypothetical protein VMZ29_03545 [Candidatus Bathyarchaeia archaeon]|nr:hypothetical protein [Candidatus Bathyarchaeia archaeon]
MIAKLNNKKSTIIMMLLFAGMLIFLTTNVVSIIPIPDTTPPTISNIGHFPVNPYNTDSVYFNCSATDASGIQSVSLYYRINGDSWIDVAMTIAFATVYEYTSGVFDVTDFVEYYFVAVDASANFNVGTNNNGGLYYNFTVGLNDIQEPEITNVSFLPTSPNLYETVTITCNVTDDFSEIESVQIFYRLNGSNWSDKSFELISGSTYEVIIGPFYTSNIFVEFYIRATDNSTYHNLVINDNLGSYFSFTVISTTEVNSIYYLIPIISLFAVSIIYKRRK